MKSWTFADWVLAFIISCIVQSNSLGSLMSVGERVVWEISKQSLPWNVLLFYPNFAPCTGVWRNVQWVFWSVEVSWWSVAWPADCATLHIPHPDPHRPHPRCCHINRNHLRAHTGLKKKTTTKYNLLGIRGSFSVHWLRKWSFPQAAILSHRPFSRVITWP